MSTLTDLTYSANSLTDLLSGAAVTYDDAFTEYDAVNVIYDGGLTDIFTDLTGQDNSLTDLTGT